MLTGGPTTEILARQQDFGLAVTRIVEHERRIQGPMGAIHLRLAMVQIAQFVEQIGTETGPLDAFEKLLRDDGVGIHVGSIQRRNQAREFFEFLHHLSSVIKRSFERLVERITDLTRCALDRITNC